MTTDRISPTAHYTGTAWVRAGLSPAALATPQGRVLHSIVNPVSRLAAPATAGNTLEQILVQRHHVLDALLERAIERDGVTQIVEIAAGLSGRGHRLLGRHTTLVRYVECDLPAMAARKRRLLERAGLTDPRHRVADLDAMLDDGPLSLAAVAASLDPARPVAFVTEGLLNYFDRASVEALWQRMVRVGSGFPRAMMVSDLHVHGETSRYAPARFFIAALSVFARGRIHLHYPDAAAAAQALRSAGFARATLYSPSEAADALGLTLPTGRAELIRLIEAWT